MLRSLLPLLFILSLCTGVRAQHFDDFLRDEIIQGDRNYATIVDRGDAYFAALYPGKTVEELCEGEYRDGKFVKWQRWKHRWAELLNEDGTLGDPTAYFRAQLGQDFTEKTFEPYASVPWTNINYTDYIISQIGMGRTEDIAFHPTDVNTFYVATDRGGVWKTTDGGLTYVPLTDEQPLLNTVHLAIDRDHPDTLYSLATQTGVYKTTDGGQTWNPTAMSFPPSSGLILREVIADPANSQRYFVVGRQGTYVTTDGFASVSEVNTIEGQHLRFQPGNPQVAMLTGRDGSIYRSADGGQTFNLVFTAGSGNPWLEFSPSDPQYVYVTASDDLVYRSTDGGQTFTQQNVVDSDAAIFMVSRTDRDVLLKGYFDLLRSNDGGSTWTQIMDWVGDGGLPSIHVDTRGVRTNPLEPDAIYICNDGGVYKYSVANNTFTNLSDGLVITQYYDIAVSQTDANIVAGGSQDNGNVFRQSDGTWVQYAGTGDGMNQLIDPTDANYRYWEYQNGGLRRWTNGSNRNIKPSGAEGAWETPIKLDPNNPQRLIAGFQSVYESLDRGTTWSIIGDSLDGGAKLNQMAIAKTNSERIYVTRGTNLFVKDVNSDNWTQRSLPAGSADLEVDAYDMDKIYTVRSGYSPGNKIYMSEDAGATWTNISRNLPNVSFATIETYDDIPGALFVGGDDGVFYTDSLVGTWQRYGNLPNTRTEDIEIQYAAQLIRVGTYGRGVLEAPIVVETCAPGAPDGDSDGLCDVIDGCPNLDNGLIGTPCDDGDPTTVGETYDEDCGCSGGQADLAYCAAAGSAGTGSDYIQQVRLGDINQFSDKTGYSDFRELSTDLEVGESYRMMVDMRAVFGPDRVHAWIDWDRNEVFDAGERIAFTDPVTTGIFYGESYGTVVVPVTATEGPTTMRVRAVYSTSHQDPCGNAFGEVEDYTVNVVAQSLPLTYAAFTAEPLGKEHALLRWNTVEEEGVSHYRVERSFDGRDFTDIGRAEATNNPSAAYDFVDENVAEDLAYYRITGVDYDGSTTVSPVRRVHFTDRGNELSVRLFPNPVGGDRLNVRWNQPAEDNTVRWLVYNQWGQEVMASAPATTLGPNATEVNVSELPRGTYLFRLRGRDFDWTGNFVR